VTEQAWKEGRKGSCGEGVEGGVEEGFNSEGSSSPSVLGLGLFLLDAWLDLDKLPTLLTTTAWHSWPGMA
jgi:hypothetical protein